MDGVCKIARSAFPGNRLQLGVLASGTGGAMNFRRMLIAVDESPIAAYAAQMGIDLARSLGAEIAFIHVFETPSISTPEPGTPEDERALAAERAATRLLA